LSADDHVVLVATCAEEMMKDYKNTIICLKARCEVRPFGSAGGSEK
jgi:hypothetical protein|tara:strand:+ start:221 stop:358 length:138 start_codon:yes stop_codon:yes gene_type:complete